MQTEKKYRYPGINFFTIEDKDIFCGRDDDAHKLFSRTMLNNTIVLHGDSGAGKSSLVRAGLIPLLEKQNEIRLRQGKPQYLPITIGLDAIRREKGNKTATAAETETVADQPDIDILVKYTLSQINNQAALRAEQLPFISPKQHHLWYTAKLFERNNYTLLLLFDQFEELQGFSPAQVKSFTEKLAGLFASTMPDELCDEYDLNTSHIRLETMTEEERAAYNNDIIFIEQPLSVRLLFALREDRLGTMSLMSDYFPDILKNDFFLQSLPEKNARQAISEPCTKPGDFASPLFTIEPEAVDAIIESLKVKQRQKGMYDPIELQIVCRRIEKKVIETGMTKVSSKDLPPVENAIREFYDEKWNIIKTRYKLGDMALLTVKKYFIEKLVVNRKRNPVLEESLVRNDMDKKIAGDLVAEGLVRIIPSGNDRIYQLCHDRFVEPMLVDTIMIRSGEDAENKARQRRRNAVIIISSVVLLSAALLFYIIYKKGKTEEENKMLNLMTTIKRAGNPTLSYIISSDWLKKNPGSAEMKKRLNRLDSSNIVYLTGMYPALSGILSAEILDKDRLLINESYGSTVWDMKTGSMLQHTITKKTHQSKKIWLQNGESRNITDYNDTLLVTDEQGKILFSLKTSIYSDNSDVCLSPDGTYLYAEESIYDIRNGLKSQLPAYRVNINKKEPVTPELTALAFISNNSLAAAYGDGCILMYTISRKNNIAIHTADTIRLPVLDYEYIGKTKNNAVGEDNGATSNTGFVTTDNRITSLRTDSRLHYLLALNSHSNNDLYSILKKKDMGGTGDTGGSRDSVSFLIELEGSSDVVTCLDFSKDGKLLLTGGNDGISTLWNLETMEKISTLRIHNGAAVIYAAFTNNDREIITATSNNMVYTWSMESPLELYKKDKLYRFAAFNYDVWYTNEAAYGKPRPTNTTAGLYTSLLHNLMNMPAAIEFRDDVIYSTAVSNAFEKIKTMHAELLSRKDYSKVISPVSEALLSKFYYDKIDDEPALLQKENQLSYLEKRKLSTGKEIAFLQNYFLDTAEGRKSARGTMFSRLNSASRYLERQGDYAGQASYIRFYEDTVLKPAKAKHPDDELIKRLQRQVNIHWFRHAILTGNLPEAKEKATVLAAQPVNKNLNDSIYLVVYHLVAGNPAESASLYKILQTKKGSFRMANDKRILQSFLNLFEQKNIAPAGIQQFKKEFSGIIEEDEEPDL